jgi:phospholipid/cholesterol/gamma-HCH transport system substrate-binding protein
MAQRGQITWTELRVGLFVIAGLVLVGLGIFYVTGAGLLGAKYRLVTYLPEVSGLAVGAPVALDGVEVGSVESLGIAKPVPGTPADPNRAVRVVLRISRDFQDYIRSDSTASLVTQGFLGDRDVDLARGFTGRVLDDGDEVPSHEEKAIKEVIEHGDDLMVKLGDIVSQIQKGQGTVGKLLVDDSLYNHLNDTVGRVDKMAAGIQQGQGTIGKLVASDELYGKVNSLTGHLDNVLEAVQDQKGTLGKLVYDPSIHDSAKEFLDNSNGLLRDVRAGRGTLGKLATDDSLFTDLHATVNNLKDVTAKLNSNSNTAGKLLSDPQLYDNLTGLTADLRLLMGEFRKNPKKFLNIKLQLF